jgi:hypothetical protein
MGSLYEQVKLNSFILELAEADEAIKLFTNDIYI